jgi:hypothetical protein
MNVPLMLVLGAAALAAWALVFRGMDQALPDRTRDLRRRLASGAADRPQRDRGAAARQPLHPALAVALVLAVLAVGILIGQERQGLGATQDPTTEVAGGPADPEGEAPGDGASGDEASDREDADRDGSDRDGSERADADGDAGEDADRDD